MITIVDYKIGNIGSIINMFKKIGVEAKLSSSKEDILSAKKLLLPGVGSFDKGMQNLEEMGLKDLLDEKVLGEKTPLLGICLGMQLLMSRSEEGTSKGLDWIEGEVKKFYFPDQQTLKVPRMGWNEVVSKKHNDLFAGMEEDARFYFVHSYFVQCHNEEDMLATTFFGHPFTSAVQKNNVFGVQFHPEKSHRYGMMLLKNFALMPC